MAGSTPVYGFPYPEATDLVADYPALGQELAEDIEAALPTVGGLAPATPTSIANSGGSASLTGNTVTFTGVSSVSLNGCFTGDYDTYRVLIRANGSTAAGLTVRMRLSGADDTSNNYWRQYILASSASITTANSQSTSATAGTLGTASDTTVSMDVFRASQAAYTAFLASSQRGDAAARVQIDHLRHNVATAYDGLSLVTSTGTMTGTVSVYGYKK